MSLKVFLATAIAGMLVLTGCNEEDGTTGPTGGSKTSLLTGATWKTTGTIIDPGVANPLSGVVVTDLFAQMDACDKDGTMKFTADGKYTEDEGATKCETSDPQTLSGTWVFNPGETVLTITETGESPISITIETLTATQLKGSYQTAASEWDDNLSRKITLTMTAQ